MCDQMNNKINGVIIKNHDWNVMEKEIKLLASLGLAGVGNES